MGCVMRSLRPRTHATAPANGGAFLAMTGLDFCVSKMRCTSLRSAPN